LPLIWGRFSSNDESLKKSWKSTGNRPSIGFVMCCPEKGGYLLLVCGPDLKLAQKRTEILKEKSQKMAVSWLFPTFFFQ
jgi:hypothetical protein